MNVLIPGTFDFFHIGHRRLLKNAMRNCHKVVIGIYTDARMLRDAGSHINREEVRYLAVSDWAMTKRQGSDNVDVDVLYLNDNEAYLFSRYKLTHIACAEGYSLPREALVLGDVLELPRLPGISSRDIRAQTHPLFRAKEVWLHPQLNEAKTMVKTKARLKSQEIPCLLMRVDASDSVREGEVLLVHSGTESISPSANVTTLVAATGSDSDSVLADILRFRAVEAIEPPRVHDTMSSFGDFVIHLEEAKIQEGGYGSIYPASHNKYPHNRYVAKTVKVAHPLEFYLECALCVRAGRQSYGPTVHAYFQCPRKGSGVIIMDRWDGDMDEQPLYPEELEELLSVVGKMHDDGIVHHDLYMRNVLYRVHPTRKESRQFCVADYGLAFSMESGGVPGNLRAADLASLVYGVYDSDRIVVMDGITPKRLQKSVLVLLLSKKILTLADWKTGIRWRVVNTAIHDGFALLPCKDLDFVDVAEMYEEIVRLMSIRIPFTGKHSPVIPVHVFLSRLAYAESLSPSQRYTLDEWVIGRYSMLLLEK
jgi:cytidyltransferase-like protein